MTNLKTLLSYDIKSIDLSKLNDFSILKEKLFKRQTLLIHITLLLITLFIANSIFSGKKNAAKGLLSEITVLEKKLNSLEKLQKTQNEFNTYINTLPEGLSADQIIGLVSELAVAHNLRVLSFSPVKKEDRDAYTQTSLKVDIIGTNYKDIGLFISDIENSDKSLKIRSWFGKLEDRNDRRIQAEEGETLPETAVYTQVEINSVNFKKNL